MPFCPKCGKEINEPINYCSNCGISINGIIKSERIASNAGLLHFLSNRANAFVTFFVASMFGTVTWLVIINTILNDPLKWIFPLWFITYLTFFVLCFFHFLVWYSFTNFRTYNEILDPATWELFENADVGIVANYRWYNYIKNCGSMKSLRNNFEIFYLFFALASLVIVYRYLLHYEPLLFIFLLFIVGALYFIVKKTISPIQRDFSAVHLFQDPFFIIVFINRTPSFLKVKEIEVQQSENSKKIMILMPKDQTKWVWPKQFIQFYYRINPNQDQDFQQILANQNVGQDPIYDAPEGIMRRIKTKIIHERGKEISPNKEVPVNESIPFRYTNVSRQELVRKME